MMIYKYFIVLIRKLIYQEMFGLMYSCFIICLRKSCLKIIIILIFQFNINYFFIYISYILTMNYNIILMMIQD